MLGVLLFLRTIICTGVGFVIWYIVANALGAPGTIYGALLPVWMAGLAAGAISAVFNARQGIMLAFTCGLLLMIGFLWVRHGYGDMGLGGNALVTLWPLWFPAAYYVGAYGYLMTRRGM
ncbi:MAG: hypothetical protein AAF529_06995 [Pseudomonadota bacterium]